MARLEILIKRSAAEEIDAISRKMDRQRIVRQIRELVEDPRPPGCRKPSGRDRFQIQREHYQIVYSIEDDRTMVYVVEVGHCSDVYREVIE